ncbi:MAG: hypothetical protein QOE70_6219 [Chthoniobacter sp.]|jgi:acetylornithine deacetylase/succinyl-diaminopimelate desuccinylase-like protein|nr:hypothetical protein [Chthoniobacter sp.]
MFSSDEAQARAEVPSGGGGTGARSIRELQEFVRIPSVSADPARTVDVERCAGWLAQRLKRAGLTTVRIVPTAGHPIVVARWQGAPGKATVLIYGHYDVQPARVEDGWRFPPFAAVVKDGHLYGRGASDDKGQMFTHVTAIERLLRANGTLPVNVVCLFEGEEEIGSPNLVPYLSRHREALAADFAVVSDTRMLSPDQPALTRSLRGQLALELEVLGPSHDLHSGSFGGAVHDPAQALCEIVARLHDGAGRIAVPGFYDRVRRHSRSARSAIMRHAASDASVLAEAGASTPWGESGYTIAERLALRPSLSVTGLVSGHTGQGPKSVIPARALAKLSFRLVPDQEPEEIAHLVRDYIASITPPTVRSTVHGQFAARPATIDPNHPAMRAAARAYARVFRRRPVLIASGGTIPAVSEFARILGIPTVLMGFASPGEAAHGPNEKFSLRNFHRGILTSMAFLGNLGGLRRADLRAGAQKRNAFA